MSKTTFISFDTLRKLFKTQNQSPYNIPNSDMVPEHIKNRQRETQNFRDWQEARQQEQLLKDAVIPQEPRNIELRIGEPCMAMRFLSYGVFNAATLVYYRGKLKDGRPLFSTRPYGKATTHFNDGTIVRFSDFSPYNLRANNARAVKGCAGINIDTQPEQDTEETTE